MEAVDPLSVQVGQRLPVRRRGQGLGLEPSHLRGRGRLRIDGTAAHDLAHDRIAGETVGIVDILVSCQSPEHRLPELAVEPVGRVLSRPVVTQRC